MAPVLLACLAAALWIAVLNKVVQLRRAPEDLPLRALAACVVSATLTFTVNLPPLRPLLDHAGPGVRSLAINIGTMAAAYFLLAFFTYSVRGPAARHTVRLQAIPLLAGIAVALLAWASAPPEVRADPADTANGTSPHATVFVIAVLGTMAYAHSQSLRWSIAYTRAAASARLRRGLTIISVAVCAFLIADATRAILAALQATTGLAAGPARAFDLVFLTGVSVGTLAFVAGVSYAAVTGMLTALPVWLAHRRYHRELAPLWTAMHRAFPHLMLGRVPPTSWRGRLGVGSVHYRFYRRVVEIRDGLVQLAPYYETSPALAPTRADAGDPATPGSGQDASPTPCRQDASPTPCRPDIDGRASVGGGPGVDAGDAARWAGLIRAALRAKEAGVPIVEADPVLVPGGDDLESDARLLAGISRELATAESAIG